MNERQRNAEHERLTRLMNDYVADLRRAGYEITPEEQRAQQAAMNRNPGPVHAWAREHAERNPNQPEDCLAARILRLAQRLA